VSRDRIFAVDGELFPSGRIGPDFVITSHGGRNCSQQRAGSSLIESKALRHTAIRLKPAALGPWLAVEDVRDIERELRTNVAGARPRLGGKSRWLRGALES